MMKDKKPDTLANIDNYDTHGHGDSMTDPAQRANNKKGRGLTNSVFENWLLH